MSNDPEPTRERRGVRHWPGPERNSAEPPARPQPAAVPAEEACEDRRRRQLLDDIGSFLLAHRLEVTSRTLAIAHDVVSGADPKLARQIEQRVAARGLVTLQWLEELGAPRRVAEPTGQNGTMIDELGSIARIMLDRTREIEAAVARSETQSQALRHYLEEARREATCDHLTGLPNRRAFEEVLAAEYTAALASGEALCVAFCDIDRFKRINDTYGHEAGDRVLKAVARTLAGISDECCHVARHGGEEFVVLLRGKTLDEAWGVLDRARETMAARSLVNRANDVPFGQITFSGGVADVIAARDPRAALAAADGALYRAKEEGRNRIYREGEVRLESAA